MWIPICLKEERYPHFHIIHIRMYAHKLLSLMFNFTAPHTSSGPYTQGDDQKENALTHKTTSTIHHNYPINQPPLHEQQEQKNTFIHACQREQTALRSFET